MSFTFLDSDDQTTQNVLSLIHMHKMVYEMPAIKKKKKRAIRLHIRSRRPEERRQQKSEQLTTEMLKSQMHLPA